MGEKVAPKVAELERRVEALDTENRRLRRLDGYSGETKAKLVTFVGGPLDLTRASLPTTIGAMYRVPVIDPQPVLADLTGPSTVMSVRVGIYRIIDFATPNQNGRRYIGIWEGIE